MPIHEDDYALVLGIQHYPSGDLDSLAGAVNDADLVHAWLLDQQTGGGLPSANVRRVVSHPDSDQPLNGQIDDAIEELFDEVEASPRPARRFYFYFSGHGMAETAIQAYLCLPKWANNRRKAALDSEDYWLMLASTGKFQEIVCLFDCCRSFKPSVGGIGSSLGEARPDKSAAQTRLFIGFAAEFLTAAWEDLDPGDGRGHGYFTRALLSGLRGGACQSSGGAPASKLKEFLETETEALARAANTKQTPTVLNGFPALAEPVFGSSPPSSDNSDTAVVYSISIQGNSDREVVVVHPDNRETPWDGSQPWIVRAGQGLHILEDKQTGDTQRLTRDNTSGEIDVEF